MLQQCKQLTNGQIAQPDLVRPHLTGNLDRLYNMTSIVGWACLLLLLLLLISRWGPGGLRIGRGLPSELHEVACWRVCQAPPAHPEFSKRRMSAMLVLVSCR